MKKQTVMKFGLVAALTLFLGACGSTNESSSSSSTSETTASSSATTSSSSSTAASSSQAVDLDSLELPQLTTEIAANEDVVDMVTSMGTIKMKLFPDLAPKAVENFMTLAKDGYYDGIIFHRVINDFMIQAGDPTGTGSGGESIWGEGFGVEKSNQLYNIRGALAMANTGAANSNGSQFFIVQNSDDVTKGLSSSSKPAAIFEAYKNGGYPYGDGKYTVFGQVIEGMDVVDAIAALDDGSDNGTKTDVTIERIDIIQEAE
ncbi:peptidylprolyl isomerase [Enterococcus sp. LJL120]